MVKYAPLEGRSWQPLPEFLDRKNAIKNIHNDNERCIKYARLYFLYGQVDTHRHALAQIFTQKKYSSATAW